MAALEFLHPYDDVLGRLLVTLGVGSEPTPTNPEADTWPIYCGREPPLPDKCITVRRDSGRQLGRDHISGDFISHKGFQIKVRADKYKDVNTKIEELKKVLDRSIYFETVVMTSPSATYMVESVSRNGDPIHVGKEQPHSKRDAMTINGTMTIYRTA